MVQFWFAVKRAAARAEASSLATVRLHATQDLPGQWTAAAWYCERRHPDRWGRRKIEQDIKHSGQLQVLPVFGADDPLGETDGDD